MNVLWTTSAGDPPRGKETDFCGHLIDEILRLDTRLIRAFERVLSRVNDKQAHRYQDQLERLREELDERMEAENAPPPSLSVGTLNGTIYGDTRQHLRVITE